jgi:hypothetical protein
VSTASPLKQKRHVRAQAKSTTLIAILTIGNAQQLMNEVIEVDLESLDGEFAIHRYPMPEEID